MRIKRRIKSRSGFTLAETMLAVLILLMVSSIVASGIPVAQNAYEKVIIASNAQVLLSTAVNALRDELGTAREVAVDDVRGTASGTFVTYISGDTGAKSKISLGPDSKGKNTIMLQEYVSIIGYNDQTESIGQGHPLISEAAVTNDLSVRYDSVTVSDDTVSFVNLKVYHGDTALASMSDAGSSDLVIRPVSIQKAET